MQKLRAYLQDPYKVLAIIFVYFIVFALIVDTPYNIFNGLIAIVFSYDILITDYVAVGGIGATLMNAAIVNLVFLAYMRRIQPKPTGSLIMVFWLLTGFAFFGKNIVNVWPIFIGGFLYAKFRGETFDKYAVVTGLATALGPTVTQIAMLDHIPIVPRIALAVAFGIMVGFVMPPISQNILKLHQGLNLYNIGFTAGILAILARIFVIAIGGGAIYPIFIWSTEYKIVLSVFMVILFAFMVFAGWICSEDRQKNLFTIFKRSGQAPSDFYTDHGEITYVNMGLLGLSTLLLMLVIRSDINGPVMGSIFTVVGFGSFGKHMKNIWPVMIGCMLAGGFLYIFSGTGPSASLAVLLVTCLAPIAGHYGWKWGVLAGFVHFNIAMNAATFSGGFNLYNNGLAAGFVVMFLVPLIKAVRKEA